jgi:hypothetical protein
MNPQELQDLFIDDLRTTLAGIPLKNANGSRAKIKLFPQLLPIPETNDQQDVEDEEETDAEAEFCPYCQVYFDGWELKNDDDDFKTGNIILVFCTYDNNANRQGYRDILNLMNRVEHRFCTQPHLGNFEAVAPMKAEPKDVDTWPYFYGVMELTFLCPRYVKEDHYYA